MRRSVHGSLIGIVVIALGLVAWNAAADNEPELGLDLQGGVSVVLRPVGDFGSGALDQSIGIIRNRVDAVGVAEPDITQQGDAIVVQLPGVRDQQRALELVGETAELRFRPVLELLPPEGTTTTTTVATQSATTVPPPPGSELTPREQDLANQEVVLPELDDADEVARYRLGPAALTGEALSTARARFDDSGQWVVNVVFTSEGIGRFNQVAATCFNGQPTCPTRSLAIVLDGVVKSAPQIQAESFQRDQVQISGDFSSGEAKDLALVLRFGALPVQLERETVQTVSATLGRDSLRAGVLAGLGGVALVALYMILYYRALGLVVILGLCVWSALLWSVLCYLGDRAGLALTLAGATGIIVSIGITVDSYVVFFERLKDEVRAGKTVRSSVERGFSRAFRTILTADTSSFMGAALLYWLTVGPVRGFAFFLGLSTILDVIVAYFFTRPLVTILSRSPTFTEARLLGVARGLTRPEGAPA